MIYINDTEGVLWITSDENPIGYETPFTPGDHEEEQILKAMAEFLGFDSDSVLCFDYR